MISNLSFGLCVLLNLILLCQGLNVARNNIGSSDDPDKLGFPESEEENPDNRHKLHKNPVITSRCKDGELYYPGDQNDDWVCDCRPGYVYYPPANQCFAAYRQGPCNNGYILILPKSNVVPECRRNPCRDDNFVDFKGSCYELDKSGPCPYIPQLANVIGVNVTTLEIICSLGSTVEEVLNTVPRLGPEAVEKPNCVQPSPSNNNETAPAPGPCYNGKECFKGGIRWTGEKCPQQNEQKNIDSIFAMNSDFGKK